MAQTARRFLRERGLVLLFLDEFVSAALARFCEPKPGARTINGRSNKSLDASGASGLVIDNLSLTWLSSAASTQTFARIAILKTQVRRLGCDGACPIERPRGFSIEGSVIFLLVRAIARGRATPD